MLAPRELLVMEKGPLGNQECTAESMTEGWCGLYSQRKKERARAGGTRHSCCCAPASQVRSPQRALCPRGGSGGGEMSAERQEATPS